MTASKAALRFQSTHPVRGGTFRQGEPIYADMTISIHPPREGWDGEILTNKGMTIISIHPPREGWDVSALPLLRSAGDFNPPTP